MNYDGTLPRTDKSDLGSTDRVRLPIHEALCFVLVQPHYPENVGACARAMKTMGFYQLRIVRPGRLADPRHDMAQKMAVRSWDVLDNAMVCESLPAALADVDFVVATTAKGGHSAISDPREVAHELLLRADRKERLALVFGNEKTGLSEVDSNLAHGFARIQMAGAQPSINLAQAVQIMAYELFALALEARTRQPA
ncbi:MAG: RNA methyltransferase [Polyangiaceae bacterium]|nr:RNA methyltransferase [Polyangiaceae bacterium]